MSTRSGVEEFFSDYRAEWATDLFPGLFIEPPYLEKLSSKGPAVLVGGRGTGKTTALRSLRFDAFAGWSTQSRSIRAASTSYLGVYIRLNKNRVLAFREDLVGDEYKKAFVHYFNVLCCLELCLLGKWLSEQGERSIDLSRVCQSLAMEGQEDCAALHRRLLSALTALEVMVNNPSTLTSAVFSAPEAPVRAMADALTSSGLVGNKSIFICLDEYENLENWQQSIVNTYIKHSEPPLAFKVGVRRHGLRCRETSGPGDLLVTPDDYAEIDIAKYQFDQFATAVAELRLQRARTEGNHVPSSLNYLLPSLSTNDEAVLLGCEQHADVVRAELGESRSVDLAEWAAKRSAFELYFVRYWCQRESAPSVTDACIDWMRHPREWADRINNHGYASLFWLSLGRKGARIRKYFSGADTFLTLASGNIRYFLELLGEAISLARAEDDDLNAGISPLIQTRAARLVARRRLDQLDSVSELGAQIKRLTLAIGKVFFEFARSPVGRAPEQNCFVLSGGSGSRRKIEHLLQAGISSLAFESDARTKATNENEMRDSEYRLHPIFCPFFEFSHRKKRHVVFAAGTLLEVLENPTAAITSLLATSKAKSTQAPLDELPIQLAMFDEFFSGNKEIEK